VSALHFQLAQVSGGAGDGIASEGGEMVAEGNSEGNFGDGRARRPSSIIFFIFISLCLAELLNLFYMMLAVDPVEFSPLAGG
jgi:hypothetical protein